MKDWNQLKYFIAIAEEGSALHAAKKLSMSHATVLRHIDKYEKSIDTVLFHRLQKGYELTEEGKALLPKAKHIQQEVIAFTKSINSSDEMAGDIVITQPEDNVLNLYPIYAKFMQAYPDVRLHINATTDVANLNQQEADIAIRFTYQPHDLLSGYQLGTLSYNAYASQSYLSQQTSNKLDDLHWLVWQQLGTSIEQSPQYKWLHKHLDAPNIVMQANNVSDIISAMRAGMGVGFLSQDISHQHPDLQVLPNSLIKSSYPLWVLTHRHLRKVNRINTLMKFIHQHFQSI